MIVRYPACQTSGRVWFDTIRLTSVSNVDFATKLCSPITAAVRPFHARAAVVPDMISWTGGQSRKQSFTCASNSLGFIAAIAVPIIQQLVELPQRRMALSHCFYWRPQGDWVYSYLNIQELGERGLADPGKRSRSDARNGEPQHEPCAAGLKCVADHHRSYGEESNAVTRSMGLLCLSRRQRSCQPLAAACSNPSGTQAYRYTSVSVAAVARRRAMRSITP